jgi:hypothetical protein
MTNRARQIGLRGCLVGVDEVGSEIVGLMGDSSACPRRGCMAGLDATVHIHDGPLSVCVVILLSQCRRTLTGASGETYSRVAASVQRIAQPALATLGAHAIARADYLAIVVEGVGGALGADRAAAIVGSGSHLVTAA